MLHREATRRSSSQESVVRTINGRPTIPQGGRLYVSPPKLPTNKLVYTLVDPARDQDDADRVHETVHEDRQPQVEAFEDEERSQKEPYGSRAQYAAEVLVAVRQAEDDGGVEHVEAECERPRSGDLRDLGHQESAEDPLLQERDQSPHESKPQDQRSRIPPDSVENAVILLRPGELFAQRPDERRGKQLE